MIKFFMFTIALPGDQGVKTNYDDDDKAMIIDII